MTLFGQTLNLTFPRPLPPVNSDGINAAFFEVVTVGNLPESEARSVFERLLLEETATTAPPLEEEDWVAVYGVRHSMACCVQNDERR